MACLYESDVSFLDVEEGVVTKTLRGEDSAHDEEIVSTVCYLIRKCRETLQPGYLETGYSCKR